MNFERETSEALLLEPPRAETFLNSWVTSNPKNAVTGRDNEVGLLPRGNLTDIPSDMSNECVEKQTLSFLLCHVCDVCARSVSSTFKVDQQCRKSDFSIEYPARFPLSPFLSPKLCFSKSTRISEIRRAFSSSPNSSTSLDRSLRGSPSHKQPRSRRA